LLAWETWWPVIGFFPVTSHTCAMVIHSQNRKNRYYIPISRIFSNYPKPAVGRGEVSGFWGAEQGTMTGRECAGRSSAFRRRCSTVKRDTRTLASRRNRGMPCAALSPFRGAPRRRVGRHSIPSYSKQLQRMLCRKNCSIHALGKLTKKVKLMVGENSFQL
jgi:hypothetical protein